MKIFGFNIPRLSFSWSWAFDFPSAACDKCAVSGCAVIRKDHEGKDHKFGEQETKKC